MTYDEIISLLPSELIAEDRANNIKKVISIYSKIASDGDELNKEYGMIMDIYGATGLHLDFIGGIFFTFREKGESDYDYRIRILEDVVKRRTPTTLPDIQGVVDSIVENGKLYVMENYKQHITKDIISPETKVDRGLPCNIYLTGTADDKSIDMTIEVLKNILPAGVFILVPVASFDTWQNIYDQFNIWQSLLDENYIW